MEPAPPPEIASRLILAADPDRNDSIAVAANP
jgi:hypothetical protein